MRSDERKEFLKRNIIGENTSQKGFVVEYDTSDENLKKFSLIKYTKKKGTKLLDTELIDTFIVNIYEENYLENLVTQVKSLISIKEKKFTIREIAAEVLLLNI